MPTIQNQLDDAENQITNAFRRLFPELSKKLIEEQQQRILTRTADGEDFEGKQFAEYRPLTIDKRKERGLVTHKVNLRFRDKMLNSIRPMFSGSDFAVVASLVFSGDAFNEEKAYQIQQGIGMEPRRFFDVSDSDMDTATETAEQMTDSMIGAI